MPGHLVSKERLLEACRDAGGGLKPQECAWIFEEASRIRSSGCWIELGFGLGTSFLAAGLGLPPGCRLIAVTATPSDQAGRDAQHSADPQSILALLGKLRPDLQISVTAGEVRQAAAGIAEGSADAVFVQAWADPGWGIEQLQAWRPKLVSGGRLCGYGLGGLEWPEVTGAVMRTLPGASTGIGAIWMWRAAPPLDLSLPLARLSVVVASTGRPSLARTLASIREQRLLDGDEVLLVHDGPPGIQSIVAWDQARLPGEMLVLKDGPHNDWGATVRTAGQVRARGTHLMWQDDDDTYLPDAFDLIRREIALTPDHMLVFRMAYPEGRLVWAFPLLQVKNVSTQNFVLPRAATLGRWGTHYQGDFEFLHSTVLANPGRPLRFVDKTTVMYSRSLAAPPKPAS